MFKFETTAETLEELAEKLFQASGRVTQITPVTPMPAPTNYPSVPAPVQNVAAAVPSPVPVAAPPMKAAPTVPPAPAVPVTAAPSYTYDQVGRAGADLIAADQAKMPDLLALLQQFGVPAITELKPEQLGPFATALRGLGAKI